MAYTLFSKQDRNAKNLISLQVMHLKHKAKITKSAKIILYLQK